jgi:hypothetical protein
MRVERYRVWSCSMSLEEMEERVSKLGDSRRVMVDAFRVIAG